MYDFDEKWRAFRFWNRMGLALGLGFLPALVMLMPIYLVDVDEWLVGVAFFLCAAAILLCIQRIQSFPCPNCGKTFQNFVMDARPKCLNCGLPRYASAPVEGMSPAGQDTNTPEQRAEIAAEFQRRYQVYVKRCKQMLIVAPCAGVLAALFAKLNHFDVTPFFFITLFGVGIGLWIAVTYGVYRCPRCKRVPTDGRYVIFDPDACPACGARFRLS
jgi:hypothetical protein